ncbi:hypothetical protein B4907_01475 [Yersinia kristensenii]|nr:hypothetical protein B4907_01475 [Yersinia kristensenii]
MFLSGLWLAEGQVSSGELCVIVSILTSFENRKDIWRNQPILLVMPIMLFYSAYINLLIANTGLSEVSFN